MTYLACWLLVSFSNKLAFQTGWAECYEIYGNDVFVEAAQLLIDVQARERVVNQQFEDNIKTAKDLEAKAKELDRLLSNEQQKAAVFQSFLEGK